MKILNVLVFGIFITTNVHAGGVYGTLYDSSDLVDPKSRFVEIRIQNYLTPKKKKNDVLSKKKKNSDHLDKAIDEKLKGLRR